MRKNRQKAASFQRSVLKLKNWNAASFSALIKKLYPPRRCSEQDKLLVSELERLASLSPHLLSDIGFRQDEAGGGVAGTHEVPGDKVASVEFENGRYSVKVTTHKATHWSFR